MPNEWIQKALGSEHHVIVLLAVNTEAAQRGQIETAFKLALHPGLRHMPQATIEMIVGALEEGIEYMRQTPLDDLTFIGTVEST